ncbi:hypothetical protein Bca101_028786 [Brassica carinata]
MAPKKDKVLPPSSKPAKSGGGKQKKKNATGVAYVLHACSKLNSEGQKCDEGTEAELAFPDDPRRQDSATFGDFVTSETDEVINAQTQRMQTEGEVECHWNMETLDIVQEEGITSAYEEQHSGKFQPKPRLLDTVIEEEPGSHYSVDDTTGANQSECMVNEESRNDECTNTAFYGEYQEEEHNIPQVHKESAPDVLEQEHRVVSPSNNDTVMGQGETQFNEAETRTDKKGEKKRGRKKKATTNEEEANKSPGKKKLKHSSRRQKNTLEKELLETPDDDIKHLPIRDMLRLVAYRESLEKKEAKGAPVVPPTQESNNTNASWDNQYYSQGFDAQDEFGMEEGENHVQVKPDSPVNYQTYMKKTPRTRWSKQETQVFYEGIQAFGINLSMVQQFLPKRRTLHQIKLKYKLEERKNPLKIDDALSTPCKDLTRYHIVLKKLQQEAAAAKEEEEPGEEAETTSDVPENEEQTKSDERAGDGVAGVKESDGEDVENGVRSDGGDQFDENEGDDDDFWNSYKRIFLGKVKLLKALPGHKYMVKFYDVYEDDDNVYVVMELCWIESWPEVVKYPEVDAKRILVQILSATAFFHLQGVVHRDLKPEISIKCSKQMCFPELLFTSRNEDAVLKVIDFGLSDFIRYDRRLNVLVTYYSVEADLSVEELNLQSSFRCVLRANPNFEDLPWPSPTGKDFVKRLLNKDHRKRMTAAQALAHLWLRDGNPGLLLDFSVYKLVRYYIRASPFRRSALKALSKAIPDEELVFLKAQFMLLDPKDGGLSLNSFTTVSVFLI